MTAHRARGTRLVERRTVSRKTPGDGKLEITKVAAGRLEPLGTTFEVRVHEVTAEARLGTMPCTCRGGDKPHVHYFVESGAFRSLAAGSEVELMVDETGKRLIVANVRS